MALLINALPITGDATESTHLEVLSNPTSVQQGQSQTERMECSVCGKLVVCGKDCKNPLCSDCYEAEDNRARYAPRKYEPLL